MLLHDKLTILLHTRNRPDLVARTLAYWSSSPKLSGARIDVLDGSDDARWPAVEELCRNQPALPHITVHHSDAAVTVRERLAAAASRCDTPYLMFAADDDFYLPGWLDEAIAQADREPELAVLHGHVLFFSLDAYAPSGELQSYFVHPRQRPPVSWLEQGTAAARIASLSDGSDGPSIIGWYALQRAENLRTIFDHATRIGLPDAYLEFWLIFYQAILGKTRMLDRLILARQVNPDSADRPPAADMADPWLEKVRSQFIELLLAKDALSREHAERVIDRYMQGVMSVLEESERRWRWRAVRNHHFFQFIWYRMLGRPKNAGETPATAYPDPRLPAIPAVSGEHEAVRLIDRWTSVDEG